MPRSRRPEPKKRITAIVCTCDRYDTLPATLAGLGEQSIPGATYEIVVVDGSSDVRAQRKFWKRRKGPEVIVHIEPEPGLSRARNLAAGLAKAPLVAFIDDDAIPSPEWLEAIAAVFDEEPQAGVVGGPVAPIWPDTAPAWLPASLASYYSALDHGALRRQLTEDEWLAGTNLACRREALIKVGGFREGPGRNGARLLQNECVETVDRLRGVGLKVFYEPKAAVRHRVHPDCISHAWLRRRVAWRTIASALAADTDGGREDSDYWDAIARYALSMPPEMRGIRGLFLDTHDAAALQRQCDAIAALMMLMVSDAHDPEAA